MATVKVTTPEPACSYGKARDDREAVPEHEASPMQLRRREMQKSSDHGSILFRYF